MKTNTTITRHQVTLPSGERFFFKTKDREEAFIAKNGGEYVGLVSFASVTEFMDAMDKSEED